MKKIFLSMTVLAVVITSHAQISGGIKAGLNISAFGGSHIGEDETIKPGFHLGGYMNIGLSEKLSFQPELLVSTAGAKIEIGGPSRESNYKFLYLSMPLSLQYSIGSFNVYSGPQLSFLMRAKTEYTATETDANGITSEHSNEEDSKKYFKWGDLGLNFGAGTNFGKLGVSVRYSLGLINISDQKLAGTEKETLNYKTNNVIQLSAMYKLFGK